MLVGIDTEQRFEFTSKQDKSEPKTIFVFRLLKGYEMFEVAKYMNGDSLNLKGERLVDYICSGLVEIKNPDTNEVRSFIESLPADLLFELVEFVGNTNNITRQDEKN